MNVERSWSDARRLEARAAEFRINVIRLVAIAGFYGYHLLDAYVLRDDPALRGRYHLVVSALAFSWAVGALALHAYLVHRWAPALLKYVATAWDLVLITAVLTAGRDAASSLAVLYFIVVAAAALRLSLSLVYASTIGAMAAFLGFHGYLRYVLGLPAEHRLPQAQQVIFLLALGVAGLLAGQVVRQARRLVRGHAVEVVAAKEG